MDRSPVVSVVLAAHNADRYLRQALDSVLRQSLPELEIVVVDDGSQDETPAILDTVEDRRLVVVRNDVRLGLSESLNHGIAIARGRYIARMDADDVALPRRLARQLERMRERPELAIVGTGIVELHAEDRLGDVHLMPVGPLVTRWRSLFGTPFLHPTVMLDRTVLERHDLHYSSAYDAGDASTEDYELWTQLLAVAEGDNIGEPLLLYRRHPAQASLRRSAHQLETRRRIALREIARVAPALDADAAELAWLAGDVRPVPDGAAGEAADALLEVLRAFSAGRRREDLRSVRVVVARALARLAASSSSPALLGRAAKLDPALAVRARRRRVARRKALGSVAREFGAGRAPLTTSDVVRIAVVSPEPTPYRSPLLDRVAERPELDLTVIYAARTLAGRTWHVEPEHRAVFLEGIRVPGARRVLHHDYALTPGVGHALHAAAPGVVVVSGWSTYTSQAALRWCRRNDVPYILLVSSHDKGVRSGWRSLLRRRVVPRVVGGAAGALVLGTLSRESLIANGAAPERVRVFANTIDVPAWARSADELAARRGELRAAVGAGPDDVVVFSVSRLSPEKGLDILVRSVGRAPGSTLLVLAGSGPEEERLTALAADLGVRLRTLGDVPHERLIESYVAADIFALVSTREPWGVVVNEAAACGLPLVLSDRVGAAPDLLVDGENGLLVPAGNVTAIAEALVRLAGDPELRQAMGVRSRELIRDWGYEPSVERFVEAVRDASR